MATQNPFYGKPSALERPVFPYCLNAILRTGGRKPALLPKKRRQRELIEFD